MSMKLTHPRTALRSAGLVLSGAAVLLAGCADTGNPSSTPLAAMTGVIHGGQTPIQGSTVTLYVTNPAATGYGQAGTLIGSATSDVNGAFTIAPSATTSNCPAGQQAYITAAGGYPSGSPALLNNSTLMMVALGDCQNVGANTRVVVNEVTTVAAAYALSGFMKTATSGALFVANVSAPALNNGATSSTTVAAGVAAAGLPHAFLNAATLASLTGAANTQTPAISVAGTSITGSVPAVEINTLGDILQTCINQATGNGSCLSLFGFTPSISGTAPTNTLQAMINLARNPYPSASAMNATTGLLSLTSAAPAFLPVLSSTPPDWSMAIVYTGTALPAQYDIALDGNDTVYAGASGSPKISALSAYGLSTPAFTAGSPGSATRQLAPDALGNVFVTNNGTTVYQFNASSGGAPAVLATFASGSDVYGVAVDKSSNVWIANAALTTPNITEYQYTAGTPATYTANYTATAPGGFEPVEVTIDGSQNIWTSDYYTNGSLASVLPNLSAATSSATPTYASTGTIASPVSATFASGAIKPLGVVIDASGDAWYGITGSNTPTTAGIEEVIPSHTNLVTTSLTPQSLVANTTLGAYATGTPGIDGSGTIFIPDNDQSVALTVEGIHVYASVPVTSSNTGGQVLSPPSGYLGCYLATPAATACGSVSTSNYVAAVYNPRVITIDSTGSVWAGITTGGFTQIIGLGAPSWPLLATGKPGLSPGLTAVNPLP